MADNGAKSTKDNSSWLESVAEYVREAKRDSLDLGGKQLEIPEVQYVLNILCNSQVTELNLESSCLTNGMVDLSSSLIKTKLKKLNVSRCRLTKEDLLQLAEILKDTQITDLDISENGVCSFNIGERSVFTSHLKQSKLTTLISDCFKQLPEGEIESYMWEFLSSSITTLDLSESNFNWNSSRLLFTSLSQSSVIDLNLQATKITMEALLELSQRLADTKIEKLNLASNNLRNLELEVLAEGLINSKVTDLNLKLSWFSNLGPLFTRLKKTQIRTLIVRYNYNLQCEKFIYPDCLQGSQLTFLDLHCCNLADVSGVGLMESLRFSNVTKLDISVNAMGALTIEKFNENVNDLNLTDLDLSQNKDIDSFFAHGKCFKGSRLKHVGLNCMRGLFLTRTVDGLLIFLKLFEGSSVRHIKLNNYPITQLENSSHVIHHGRLDFHQYFQQVPQEILASTTFTELELSCIDIGQLTPNLISFLKYSKITHLNLASNKITDNGAIALAEYLKTCQVRRLNLNNNLITSEGAKVLATAFKDSHLLYLHLTGNKIENDGLELLAEHAKRTFISVLEVRHNAGDKIMLVEEVLWRNKTTIQKLVDNFKQIAPKNINDEFCFNQSSDDSNVSTFLERYLSFYKAVIDPRAAIVLQEEKATLFSTEELFDLISEKFPLQFSQFIACRVEADLLQHVSLLEKAEEMSLIAIVRELLYNREAYTLDRDKGILHPYVYKLLRKYNQPICSSVEPHGIEKIIEYFNENTHIEGAKDVVTLLTSANIS